MTTCSHGAFKGSYSTFDNFRRSALRLIGGQWCPSHDPDRWYFPQGMQRNDWPGLVLFFESDDCCCELSASACGLVARDLDRLSEMIARVRGGGRETVIALLRQFATGCRRAYAAGEPLIYS